jgi:probable HAF family extracellular repeat protein
LACAVTTPALAANYSITDLGYSIQAYAINNNGDVLASGTSGGGDYFVRSASGSIQYLTIPYGGYPTPGPQAEPTRGISDSGVVVGMSRNNAAKWVNGTPIELGSGQALAINNNGQIVGTNGRAVLWQTDGTQVDLGANPCCNGTWSSATSINDNGQIAGTRSESGGYNRAFLWVNGSITEIGTLGIPFSASSSTANAVNDLGHVVGGSQSQGQWWGQSHGYIWMNGAMTDLGSLSTDYGSEATGINNSDQVIGRSADANGNTRPFLWQAGTMTDLNSLIDPGSGWSLGGASSINNQGQIVGVGYLNGEYHGYLISPVPEPGNHALMIVGLGLVGFITRRASTKAAT